ncbi:MAG: DUF3172 domain-containing protein [Pseudanabaenaceae cyanobacterium]
MARRRSTTFAGTPPRDDTSLKIAVAGAIFILGIGVGLAISTLNPTVRTVDVTRLEYLAGQFCTNFGYAAVVTTNRIYVTLNPYNVYVSQSDSQPGCVVLPNNWNQLQQRQLITGEDIQRCRARLNTFGYAGNIDDPQSVKVDCIYESKDAQAAFLPQNPQNTQPTP